MDVFSTRSSMRALTKSVLLEAHVIVRTDCTTCAGNDISCTTCGGDGTTTADVTSYFRGRVLWRELGQLRFVSGGVLAGGETGDVQIVTDPKYKALMLRIKDNLGYIVVDGEKVKPDSVSLRRIERGTTLDVRCNIVGNPRTY